MKRCCSQQRVEGLVSAAVRVLLLNTAGLIMFFEYPSVCKVYQCQALTKMSPECTNSRNVVRLDPGAAMKVPLHAHCCVPCALQCAEETKALWAALTEFWIVTSAAHLAQTLPSTTRAEHSCNVSGHDMPQQPCLPRQLDAHV